MRDIIVNAHADGFDLDFWSYTPAFNHAGISAQVTGSYTETQAFLTLLTFAADASFGAVIQPLEHKPPAGYHFGAMDPSGEHYMIKDGDSKNTPVITPWYSAQIQDNINAFNKSTADLSLGLLGVGFLPGAGPFVGFVGAVMTVLSWGAAHSDPATSPIFP